MNSCREFYKNHSYDWQTNRDEVYEEAWKDIFIKSAKELGHSNREDLLLDIACGKGDIIPFLPPCNYVGVDISLSNIQQAKHLHPEHTFFIVADASNLPFNPNTFNKIISVETVEHLTLKELNKALSELKRIGKHLSTVVITAPNLFWLWGIVPWSLFPLRRRLSLSTLLKGMRNGYVDENVHGFSAFHYRFTPKYLKSIFTNFFRVDSFKTTFWYNNRALGKIKEHLQTKILRFSSRRKLLGLNVGAVLIYSMKIVKD
jgi:SAM-dependent methyltransferase